MKYKVGVCQFEPKLFEVKQNRQTMYDLVKDEKADLIVFPELATSGYIFNSIEKLRNVAENAVDGKTAAMFKELSQKNDCSYVIGIPEVYEDKYYNSSILINPDGSVHVYRKVHLFYEEKLWFEPGDLGFGVFEAKNGVKVGLMICFDWIFPESARTLALNGAEIIAHATNLVLPWCQQAMITRSLENRVFSITANRFGLEKNDKKELYFTGQSQIVSPSGELYFRLEEQATGVRIIEIETEDSHKKNINQYNHVFNDRRTNLYNK